MFSHLKITIFAVSITVLVGSTAMPSFAKSSTPQFSLGMNVFYLPALAIGAKKSRNLTYIPILISGQYRIRDHLSLTMGALYRYENYPPGTGPRLIDIENPWHHHHDIFVLMGARYTKNPHGITGFYAGGQIGAGYSFSPNYYEATVILHPEIGYTWAFSAFFVELGGSIMINVPLATKRNIDPLLGGGSLNPMHRFIPIINLSLGVAL